MKKLVLGALNIDRTYNVEKIVLPMETVAAEKYESFCGGKGFNQTIALSRAGSEVYFAGVIGYDGGVFLEEFQRDGVKTDFIKKSSNCSGHAVIQIDRDGQNCIIIVPGSNAEITEEYIDEVLDNFSGGDLIVLQNEVPCVGYAISEAWRRGLIVAFNPSPINDSLKHCDLSKVSILIVNEVEGVVLSGAYDEDDIIDNLKKRYPELLIVFTKGESGSVFVDKEGRRFKAEAITCDVVDTTAAGDTFTGYFLNELLHSNDPEKALHIASFASGISVTKKGASPSIPLFEDVIKEMNRRPQA